MPFLCQEWDTLVDEPRLAHQDVHETGFRLEQVQSYRSDDDPGQEVGKVQNGLADPLEPLETQLIQQDGKDDGHRETETQIQEVENQGVGQGAGEILVPEDLLEGGPTHPLAAGVALGRFVIHPGHAQTRVGCILEDDHENHRDQQQEIQLPVVGEILQCRVRPLWPVNHFLLLQLHGYPPDERFWNKAG